MVQIKCNNCNAIHNIKKENILNRKGKKIEFKCKNCNKPIRLIIN